MPIVSHRGRHQGYPTDNEVDRDGEDADDASDDDFVPEEEEDDDDEEDDDNQKTDGSSRGDSKESDEDPDAGSDNDSDDERGIPHTPFIAAWLVPLIRPAIADAPMTSNNNLKEILKMYGTTSCYRF